MRLRYLPLPQWHEGALLKFVNPSGDDVHLDGLKDAIQAAKLVAIMGTGVSLAVGAAFQVDDFTIASWHGLIRHGIYRCRTLGLIDQEEATNLETMVWWKNVDHLIHVAETVTKKLTGAASGTYQKWLGDTVGQLEVGDGRLIHALARIAKFLASLNYDTLPEKVLQRASVSWNQPHLVNDVVYGKLVEEAGQKLEAVVHLHGCWRDAASVVLGTASYNDVANHPHAQAIQQLFAVGHTMMFVGCGETLADPNFSQFIPIVTKVLGPTTRSHYVLCLKKEVAGWKAKNIPWLHPIGYGDKHEDLIPFLESLSKYGGEPPPEPSRTEPPLVPPEGGSTFGTEWDRLAEKLKPEVAAELVQAGRKAAVEKLDLVAKGDLDELGIQSRFANEIVTFVAGFLAARKLSNTPEGARWKLTRDQAAWQKTCEEKSVRNILVAHPDLNYEANRTALLRSASANGHAVVYGTLLGRPDNNDIVRLGQPARHEVVETLKKGGVPGAKAERLATQSNGNLPLLLRYLTDTPERPEWAKPAVVAKIRPLALLGGWRTDNPRDIEEVGVVIGGDYHAWISDLFPVIHGVEPPFVHHQNIFRPISRYENWQLLGTFLTDDDLERFKQAAVSALRDDDSRFDTPSDKRAFSISDPSQLRHSETLRQGLAETAALLGGQPGVLHQCSPNKAREVAFSVVHAVLKDADWKRWASLGSLLSLLAEADPETYLGFVRADLNQGKQSAIRKLFGEVEGGIFGGFYHSGLLWSLEVLAWRSEYLSRVALILAELDELPLPDNLGNRPLGSLRTTLLPWLPQTLATLAERKSAVETVIRDFPKAGWKLLIELLPDSHGTSSYNQRPVWRDWIPPERDEGVTNGERREQERVYAELALNLATTDADKLKELFDHLLYLPKTSFDAVVAALKSPIVTDLPDRRRLPLWQRVVQEVRRHRKFADADWAAPAEIIALLEEIAALIQPKAAEVRHQFLFNFDESEFWETDDYVAEGIKVREKRRNAIADLFEKLGVEGILTFAREVERPFDVGVAFGGVNVGDSDSTLLPKSLHATDNILPFIRGYVAARFEKDGFAWVERLHVAKWMPPEIGLFFSILPFTRAVWECAEKYLGHNAADYWQHIEVYPRGDPAEVVLAVEKLLNHDRGPSALRGINNLLRDHQPVSAALALRTIQSFLRTFSAAHRDDACSLTAVIEFLQNAPDANQEQLAQIEWNLLPMFDRHSDGSPRTLERKLATEPDFFVETIRGCYRGKGEERPSTAAVDEEKKSRAERCYRLLHNWSIVPGTAKDGTFDPAALHKWIEEVRKLAEPSGHWEVAQTHIGNVLVHAPKDPNGLFMHRGAAAILDSNETDDMRRGYRIELFNSRGAYVAGSGKADRDQQAVYEDKAQKMNAAGFTNIAATLRSLAQEYAHIVERHEKSADPDV